MSGEEQEERIEDSARSEEEEEITATQALEVLHIGHTRLAQLLSEWESTRTSGLSFRLSPLDHRVRLIKRSDVNELLQRSQGRTVEQARHDLAVSNNKILSLIKSGELPVRVNPLNAKQRLVDEARFAQLLADRQAHRKRQRPQGKSSEKSHDAGEP